MEPETEVDEEKSKRLEERIEQFKKTDGKTLIGKVAKGIHFFLIVDVGGSLLPKYQRRHTRKLGWEEKDLTIRNAVYCGILPALGYAVLNQYLGDNVNEMFQKLFYGYPGFMFGQNVIRTALAQITKNPIPSISFMGALGNLGYFIADSLKKKKSEEKVEACGGI